jgi:ribosome modulation factor
MYAGKTYAWQQGFVAGLQGKPAVSPAGLAPKHRSQWAAGHKAGVKRRGGK